MLEHCFEFFFKRSRRNPSARNRAGSLRPWIGEIDRAVGFHHHIVWAVEPPPLNAVRQNRLSESSRIRVSPWLRADGLPSSVPCAMITEGRPCETDGLP